RLLELVDRLLQSAVLFHHAPPLSCSGFTLGGRPRFFGAAGSPSAAAAGLRPRFFGAASAAGAAFAVTGAATGAASTFTPAKFGWTILPSWVSSVALTSSSPASTLRRFVSLSISVSTKA